ncbi:hypothetical protein BLSTO_04805 [Blastocystis sp. subtype 1]
MASHISSLSPARIQAILSPVKAVIFDVDGTLTYPGLINFKRIRERARVPIGQDIFPYILAHYKGEEYKRAMEAVEEEELLAQKDLRLQPGVNELLALLNERGIKVGLLTRNSRKSMNNVLNLITAKVDAAYSREIQPSKPNVDPFLRFSKELGVPCDSMLLAGDHLDDFIASIVIHSRSCYVRPNYKAGHPGANHIPVMPSKDGLSLMNCQQVPPYVEEYRKTHARYIPDIMIDGVAQLLDAWKSVPVAK